MFFTAGATGGSKFSNFNNLADATAQKFVDVIKGNDVKSLRKMINKKCTNFDSEFRFESGVEKMTGLHFAAKEGQLEVVQQLLNAGCDPNKTTPYDALTPMHFACRLKNQDVVYEIVKELVNHGADVNRPDHSQCTPLIISSEQGHLKVVTFLLDSGSDIDHQTGEEEYPIAVTWSLENLTLQEKDTDEMCDPFMGNNALLQACREHHLHVILELIQRGSDVDSRNSVGNTPLHIACKSESRYIYSDNPTRAPVGGHIGVINLLTSYGCDLNPRNRHAETPIKRAMDGIVEIGQWNIDQAVKMTEVSNFFDVIIFIIKTGCDVTVVDGDGIDLLHTALKTAIDILSYKNVSLDDKFKQVCKMLVITGCQPTPAHVQQCHMDILRFPDVMEYLIENVHTPTSLKNQCRQKIRMSVCKPLVYYLPTLNLPPILKRYVSLENLE